MADLSVDSVNAALLSDVARLAVSAGDLIMGVYGRGSDIAIDSKDDDSPLTEADLLAHEFLFKQLSLLTPSIPILSEEGVLPDYEIRKQWPYYWLIDPLDGTKEFISRNGEFTVNIALIYQHRPILGVVYAPVKKVLYKAINTGGEHDCCIRDKSVRANMALMDTDESEQQLSSDKERYKQQGQPFRLVLSRHHGADLVSTLCDDLQEHFGVLTTKALGSSLKLCAVAEGGADLYPRFGPTSEWDTAAGQAIVEAAGGAVVTTQLEPLRYNTKNNILNPDFYVLSDKVSKADSGSGLGAYLSLLSSFASQAT